MLLIMRMMIIMMLLIMRTDDHYSAFDDKFEKEADHEIGYTSHLFWDFSRDNLSSKGDHDGQNGEEDDK